MRGFSLTALVLVAAACSRTGDGSAPSSPGASAPAASPLVDRVAPLPSPLPEVVARVNGQPVPLNSVRIFATRGGSLDDRKAPGAFRDAVQHFVVRELLFQEAMRRGVKADDRAVEQKYDEAHLPYKDEKSWSAFLEQQGMDVQAFRTELRVQYTVQALMQQVSEGVPSEVTDDEAREFFLSNPERFETGERLRARHILLRVPREVDPSRKDEFRTRAEGLLARIRTGEDFAELAREHSEDVGSKGKGGALQVFARGQMVPAFEEAAFALQPGEVSDVVETPFGFHIVKLDQRLPSEEVPLDAVMKQVKEHIRRERQQRAMQALVAGLRAKAKIETFI